MTEFAHPISRRAFLGAIAALALAPAALAADHPALSTMRQVAKDLLHANRLGTAASFRRVIMRHADVTGIGNYSLGQYQPKLAKGQRESYYGGVATFMSRYFADQSRDYRVAKYELGEATAGEGKAVKISSKVFMLSGQTYTVQWTLGWIGGRYKVTDAKVLGFSLVYMQRGIFTSYISKRKGDVNQLVAALNR
jgi:phospholipid transport system substrate-binding protein